ncbi:MAG TPA: methyl-accepting chemotaxis protein, partial [Candidatus Omnitrophota bacterium]|nr:methyl-accepting chemotaxis protein [Candidatus Omnitrophota bacterium]
MTGRIRISWLLPSLLVSFALAAAATIGLIAYNSAREQLVEQAQGKMQALLEARKSELGAYLAAISEDVTLLADGHSIRDVLNEFEGAYEAMGADAAARLQRAYIADNPNPVGKKHLLDAADDGSTYATAHAKYHPWLRSYADKRGYYDVFLIAEDGDVVYTVFKEADFATNLMKGAWKDTDLGRLYREVLKSGKATSFTDFKGYAPSAGAPASFIMTPIKARDGHVMGALAFQMPIDRLNKVMQVSAGMGESGETYIVGSDRLMRSDSRFAKESTILKTKVDNASVERALAGDSGIHALADYRGVQVFSAFAPLEFMGVRWAMLAEIDEAEVLAPVARTGFLMMIAGLVVAVVVAVTGLLAARRITGPVAHMTRAMKTLAQGDLDIPIPALHYTNEIGQMAHAVEVFKRNAIEVRRLEAEQEGLKRKAEEQRKATMMEMADSFEQSVGAVIKTVTAAATELQAAARQMAATAQSTSAQVTSVGAATEQASANVETVASATEELTASIAEIGGQVGRSNSVAEQATAVASQTSQSISRLSANVSKVGEVVQMITGIAAQTNLL